MFGTNELTGKKFFEHARPGHLLVTSIFYTIQGEGPFAGMPAIFLRLAKCQLACSFCDTYFDKGDWLTPSDIYNRIMECLEPYKMATEAHLGTMLCVVTGGEPMLQANIKYLRALLEAFKVAQIESNGLLLQEEIWDSKRVHLVVSPKAINGKYGKLPAATLWRTHCLKFVMNTLPPYHVVPAWAFEWQADTGRDIYVSPMAEYLRQPTIAQKSASEDIAERNAAEIISFWEPDVFDHEAMQANYRHAARYALMHNLKLSVQMHLFCDLA